MWEEGGSCISMLFPVGKRQERGLREVGAPLDKNNTSKYHHNFLLNPQLSLPPIAYTRQSEEASPNISTLTPNTPSTLTTLNSNTSPSHSQHSLMIHPEMSIYVLNLAEDCRPYCRVDIYGEPKEGLLDSGASISVLRTCVVLSERYPILNTTNIALKAANGSFLTVMGWVPIPIGFRGATVSINAIVVEDITQDLILEVEFFKAAGLRIVNQEGAEVGAVDGKQQNEVSTEVELQERDKQEFQRVVHALPVSISEDLTKTPLIEHVIELKPESKPFTIRPHLYSPYLEEKMNLIE